MIKYQIVWEMTLNDSDANTPLDAAIVCNNMLKEKDNYWQFYVQDYQTKEIFSVDLEENDEDAVLPVTNYKPIIETNKI